MSQYSETLGSFLRNGNFPLEADYIFSSEEALKEFYSNPTRKVTLHKGLLKVVAQDNKLILYWVVLEGEELQFTKLIEANSISEIQASLDDLIEALILEIQDRKDAINEVYGTDNPTELPELLSNIKKIIEALLELQNTVAYKEELKAVVGTEQDDIPNYLSTLDYLNITLLSEKLADFLKGQDPEITLREVQLIIKNRIDNLQRELDTTQAGVGLNGDGSFDQINMKNTTYLDGTTSVIEALKALDREMSTLVVDAFILDAYYDTTTEEIVLTFITKLEKTKTIRISMTNLIREWEPDNTNPDRVVELYREEVHGGGADKLSADVRLSTSPNNILEKDGNTLLVRGTSDNITHKGESLATILDRFDGTTPVYETLTHALLHESKDGSIFVVLDDDNLGEKGFYIIFDKQPTRIAFTSELEQTISNLRDEVLRKYVKRSEMGVANGIATLDSEGKVPASQLPSYVDDIIDVYAAYTISDTGVLSNISLYSDVAHTQPIIGEPGKIYQNIADGEPLYLFRWTGTIFSQTGASSLILGEVTGTAYDGAKGKANADNIAKIKGTSLSHIKDAAPVTTAADKVSLNYECFEGNQYGAVGTDHTADIPAATTAKAGVMSAADKTKLEGVEAGAQVNAVTSVAGKTGAVTLAKADVGLGNVDNTSDANKPVSTAQATAIADAKKAGTDAQTALNTYEASNNAAVEAVTTDLANHKLDKDKKHIPSGGHERQILAWESDGTAKWDDLANMFTGLEELLAYGVEWKDNVADPHLTRIGNMSLHKTLPIQSQLKGCIAQKDKVMYWLAEDDWRFRKDPIYMTVDLSNDVEHPNFGEASIASLAVGQFVKAGTHIGKIAFIEGTSVTVEWEEDLGDISVELTAVTKLEIGSRLDGYDGTVRVYCPNFYIKSQVIGNTRRVWLSTVKINNTWTYQHEILIDAYRSTVLNTVPENMGYLSTLPVNSAISVVNTAAYCRGGNNRTAYDKYLEGVEASEGVEAVAKDIFRTDLGKPRTSQPRSSMRTEARNAGSEMLSYDQYKNIFYWLYVVEYANFNCQEAYNAELTDDGYHQGGLGNGVTNVSDWRAFNDYYPITPCGYGNDLGNGTGVKLITSPGLTPANGVYMCRWRGFDNPFGDIWTNLDGIIIDADAVNHPNNMNYVYTCQDPEKYADNLNGEGYEKVGEEIHQDGYTKLFDLGDAAHIIPNVMGGNTTQYKCDSHWTGNKNATLRTLLVGGGAYTGAFAGLGAFDSRYGVSYSWADVGFRSVSLIS